MRWTFTAPTERVDGRPLPASEIAYFLAYIDGMTYEIESSAREVIVDLPDGTYCCEMRTVTTDEQPSEMSNSVCQTQDTELAPPKPPVVDEITLNPVVTPSDGAVGVPVDTDVIATWPNGTTDVNVEINVTESDGTVVPGAQA